MALNDVGQLPERNDVGQLPESPNYQTYSYYIYLTTTYYLQPYYIYLILVFMNILVAL